ncbi:hypothetical protein AB7M49_001817 [Bradyrhizobium elkanii]
MEVLATLVMWILAGVAAAALGAQFLRRTPDRPEPEESVSLRPVHTVAEGLTDRNTVAVDQPVQPPPPGAILDEDEFKAPESLERSPPITGTDIAHQADGASLGTEGVLVSNAAKSIDEDPPSADEKVLDETREAHVDVPASLAWLDASDEKTAEELEQAPEQTASETEELGVNEPEVQNPPPASHGEQEPRKHSVHRDRRGQKRSRPKTASPQPSKMLRTERVPVRASADIRLRLELHPIRETVQLFLVPSRPEEYPDTCIVDLDGGTQLHAYDETRYDDVDLEWLPDTLTREFRLSAPGGFRWIRSARRVHIFSRNPSEPGLVSASAVVLGQEHVVICRSEDCDAVRELGHSTGSSELQDLTHWGGVPTGWCVLGNYTPHRAVEGVTAAEFSSLDPLYDLKIIFVGGLQLRGTAFAEGHAPRIEVPELPAQAKVEIDGKQATADATGAWQADGWDTPGVHLIDVVPGPSLQYEIVADPAGQQGWPRWQPDAIFPIGSEAWTRTSICGASVVGIRQETVLAHETTPLLVALGSRGRITPLRRRSDANVSIALPLEPPAFLLTASGPRRHQGKIIWLGIEVSKGGSASSAAELSAWASTVRSAAARRLPIQTNGSVEAKSVWQKATRRARRLRRQMHER